jgi:two-component system sensor histidine kinase KdpD
MVEAHGGQIWAENGPQGGAVFRFTLPIVGTLPALPDDTLEATLSRTDSIAPPSGF